MFVFPTKQYIYIFNNKLHKVTIYSVISDTLGLLNIKPNTKYNEIYDMVCDLGYNFN